MSNNLTIRRHTDFKDLTCGYIDCSINQNICSTKGCGPCSTKHGTTQRRCTKKRLRGDDLTNRYNNSYRETETFRNFKMGELFFDVFNEEDPQSYKDITSLTPEEVKKELEIEFNNNQRNPQIKTDYKNQEKPGNKTAKRYADYVIKNTQLHLTKERLKKYYDGHRLFRSKTTRENAGRQFKYFTLTPISSLKRKEDKARVKHLIKTCGNYDPHMTVEYSRNTKNSQLEISDAHFTCGMPERDLNGNVLSAQSWQIDQNDLQAFSRNQQEYSQTQQHTTDQANIEARSILEKIQESPLVSELYQYFNAKIQVSNRQVLNVLINIMKKCLLIENKTILTKVSTLIGNDAINLNQKLQEIDIILEKQGVLINILNKYNELDEDSLFDMINDYLEEAGAAQNVYLYVQNRILTEIKQHLEEKKPLNEFFVIDNWEGMGKRKSLKKKRKRSRRRRSKNKKSRKKKGTNKKRK